MADIPYQSADRFGSTINIWVYVQVAGGENNALVAPFWIPKGISTLVWNLVTLGLNQGVSPAVFALRDGVTLSAGPLQKVTILGQGRTSDTQYWIAVQNEETVAQALLAYDIHFGGGFMVRSIYDPTIIVATDPIDPPPGEGGPA
ncbi:MAG TPA: hypothetical protein VMW27_00255 [Thermoanaerobaculia bacterium]|nr:hypothetical protein [Thermoanaerobaculia bacterium]